MKPTPPRRMFLGSALVVAALFGCGGELGIPDEGGSGAAIPDTPLVALGPLDENSSIKVNGVSFRVGPTTETIIETADDDGRGLRPGMMVRIEAFRTAAPGEARAVRITSGAEVRGPVERISVATGSFVSNRIGIDVDAATRFEGLANGLASLQPSDNVQVHGYPTGDNRVRATLVRKREPSEQAKLTGTVAGLSQAAACTDCKAAGEEFFIGGLVVRPTRGAGTVNGSPLENGSLVKITGFFDTNPNVFIATEIRRYEGARPNEGVDVTLRGVYKTENAGKDPKEFSISGLPVRVDASTRIVDGSKFGSTLAPGNLLEVEGDQVDGYVRAKQVIRR